MWQAYNYPGAEILQSEFETIDLGESPGNKLQFHFQKVPRLRVNLEEVLTIRLSKLDLMLWGRGGSVLVRWRS